MADLPRIIKSIQNGQPWGIALITLLVTWFWIPGLLGNGIIIHGDSAHHGLSLLHKLSEALWEEGSLVWDSRIYGGHPLFAEGQGAFLNPLSVLTALVFDPFTGTTILHWLAMLTGGLGTYCLSRQLDIRPWFATLTALGVTFSGAWITFQSNYTVSSTLMWAPWVLVSIEYWIKSPTLNRALILVIPVVLMVFSGYPHLTHGIVLYVSITMLAIPLTAAGRSLLKSFGKVILTSGLLAAALAIAISSAQLIPLFELVSESHRESGTAIIWPFTLEYIIRGALYFYNGGEAGSGGVDNITSPVLLFLAALPLLMKLPFRIFGHVLATFLIFNLGMQNASPIFSFLYANHLVPGLHYYRAMHLFMPIAVIGVGVLSGFALEQLFRHMKGEENAFWTGQKFAACAAAALLSAILYLLVGYYSGPASLTAIFMLSTVSLLLVSCVILPHQKWLPLLLTLVVSADILANRMIFTFHARPIQNMPESISKIMQDPDWKEFRVMDTSLASIYVFRPARDPILEPSYRRFLANFAPMPASLWGISSINGNLALQLERRELVDKVLINELQEKHPHNIGYRLIDILGIKYISAPPNALPAGLEPYHKDPETGATIYRNSAAKPRFQFYASASYKKDAKEVLSALLQAENDQLFIEGSNVQSDPAPACRTSTTPRITVHKNTSTEYFIEASTECPGWLFLADANYPGWQAVVNGEAIKVRSAQVLGKAIPVSAGRNVVELRFVPYSLYLGAAISLAALVLWLLLVARGLIMSKHQ